MESTKFVENTPQATHEVLKKITKVNNFWSFSKPSLICPNAFSTDLRFSASLFFLVVYSNKMSNKYQRLHTIFGLFNRLIRCKYNILFCLLVVFFFNRCFSLFKSYKIISDLKVVKGPTSQYQCGFLFGPQRSKRNIIHDENSKQYLIIHGIKVQLRGKIQILISPYLKMHCIMV